mmetsp:Transcript_1074/g.1425  ORF Transcript_1074/g.1425 Transcript_1074/m.1425 type:complete len:98 (+) Transcript_1074:70-363(+)
MLVDIDKSSMGHPSGNCIHKTRKCYISEVKLKTYFTALRYQYKTNNLSCDFLHKIREDIHDCEKNSLIKDYTRLDEIINLVFLAPLNFSPRTFIKEH